MLNQKSIVIKSSNSEKIEKWIGDIQKKCSERLMDFKKLENCIKEIDKKFQMLTKKEKEGLCFWVDYHATKYPRAYKYSPQSTQVLVVFKNGNWRLSDVSRYTQSKSNDKQYSCHNITDLAQDKIMKQFKDF